MKNKTIKEILATGTSQDAVTINGWVKTRRDSKGGFSFIEVNDGSCFLNIQIIADNDLPNYNTDILKIHPGASISVKGVLVESPGSKQTFEVKAIAIHVYGFVNPSEYPLQKKRISFEKLREIAHLRPRTNTFGAMNRIRNSLSFATHQFFQDKGFIYLNTPIITSNDCEGAGEMFRVSTLDPEHIKKTDQGKVDWSKDFFEKETSLTVSGQLAAETHACALSRVYTFGPTFRAENSNTSRHLAEFWMLEPEIAFADLDDNANLAESYLKTMFQHLLDHAEDDLQFFNQWVEKGLIQQLEHVASTNFVRMSYTEAVKILQSTKQSFKYPVKWGSDLQSEHERYLTEIHVKKPVILTDYPKEIKAFYMRLNDDEKTVQAMDVLVPKIGEIIGGSQREERLDVLEQNILNGGMELDAYWWYLDLRRFGSVPHAGFGLGFERLIQYCTGFSNIRDVIPFPRTPKNANF